MKKSLSILILLLAATMSSVSFAQKTNIKLGHINSQELLSLMPERDSAQAAFEKYQKGLSNQIDVMQVELNKKYQDYLSEQDNLTDLIKKTKEQEINDLDKRIKEFQQTAQQGMQKKQNDLMQPIIEKAQKAIKDVARENGFTYIFDLSTGGILYFSDDTENILPLVKTKLGLK